MNKRLFGQQKEALAARHLKRQGLKLVARNYLCPFGEIDLIAEDRGPALVFVEVRYRNTRRFGGAAASVTNDKQRKVIHSAQHFLQNHPQWQHSACRFDVIAIENHEIEWIRDAFRL